MSVIFHILKYKFLSFIKLNVSLDSSTIAKNIGSFIVYASFAVGAFYFSYAIVKYLLEVLKLGLFLLHEFLSITFFIFFIAVNVGNIIVSYSTLYKSQEVNYLFNKPINPTAIFTIKFLDNFFYSSSTLILILVSVLSGYAYYLQLNVWEAIIIFLFSFIPFMLSAAALGIIVLLLIVKLSTLIGTRIVLFTLATLYLVSLMVFFTVTSPVDLVNQVMKYYPNVDLYFGALVPSIAKYLPNHWLSESLYWIARDNYVAAGQYFYLQIVLSFCLILLALFLGSRWYQQTWFYSFKLRKQNAKPDLEREFSFNSNSKLSRLLEVIFKREYHLFLREPTQVFHIIVLLILITIFLSSVSSLVYLGGLNIFMQTIIYLTVFIFNTFMVATLSLRFIFPLFSLEGKAFWKIKSAPISGMRFIRLKLTPYLLTIIFISLVLSVSVNRLFSLELLLIMIIINVIISISIVTINFALGSVFAIFTEKNPIRISSSQGASLSFLINLIYMVFLIVLFYLPINIYFETLIRNGTPELTFTYYAAGVLILVLTIILVISHLLINKSLRKDF